MYINWIAFTECWHIAELLTQDSDEEERAWANRIQKDHYPDLDVKTYLKSARNILAYARGEVEPEKSVQLAEANCPFVLHDTTEDILTISWRDVITSSVENRDEEVSLHGTMPFDGAGFERERDIPTWLKLPKGCVAPAIWGSDEFTGLPIPGELRVALNGMTVGERIIIPFLGYDCLVVKIDVYDSRGNDANFLPYDSVITAAHTVKTLWLMKWSIFDLKSS